MFTMPDEEWEDTMVFTRGVTDNMKYSVNRIQAINALVSDKSERYTYYSIFSSTTPTGRPW